MSPSDMFGSKHFATGCATMNINVNIMLTPIHIIRMAPISLEFTKEHKTSFFRGCASSRLDEAQPSAWEHNQSHLSHKNELGCAPKRWVALHLASMKHNLGKWYFFLSSLVNLCLPDHRLFCLSKNLKESVKKQKNVTFVSFFPLSLSVFFLSFFSFYSAFVFFRFCCFAFSLFRRWYFFRFFRVFREVRICYGLDDINLPKKIKKNIIFQGCASSRRDEAQPSVWGRNQAHFCAINDFGCAPKHLVVLHRGEMKRNPEKMMFSVLW